MNIQALRYVVQIGEIGSINQAAQKLYISQSALSRAVQEIEAETGIIIFQRSNKGVNATPEGKRMLQQAKQLLQDIDRFQSQYFINQTAQKGEVSLLLGVQRSYPAVIAFLQFYQQYYQANCINLVLREGTREEILELICHQIMNLGIIHSLSVEEEELLKECESKGINCQIIKDSPICVQVRKEHPLSKYKSVTLDMLEPYPRIAFLDEDVTGINYCSDVLQYDRSVLKKRIVVQERGTQREIIGTTDAYYIGNKYILPKIKNEGSKINIPISIVCIPLENMNTTIETAIISRKNYKLTEFEEKYLEILSSFISEE